MKLHKSPEVDTSSSVGQEAKGAVDRRLLSLLASLDLTYSTPSATMAPERSAKNNKPAGDASVNQYRKASKKVKPELPKEEKLQKKWRSLKDQVDGGFLENAFKTSQRSE